MAETNDVPIMRGTTGYPFDWLTGFPGANQGRAFSPGPGEVADLMAVHMGRPRHPGRMSVPDLVRCMVAIETLEADLKEAKRRVTKALVEYLDQTWRDGYDREVNDLGRRFRITAVPFNQDQYDPEALLEQIDQALLEGVISRTQATAIVTVPPGTPRIDRSALERVLKEAPALAEWLNAAKMPLDQMNRNLRVQQVVDPVEAN